MRFSIPWLCTGVLKVRTSTALFAMPGPLRTFKWETAMKKSPATSAAGCVVDCAVAAGGGSAPSSGGETDFSGAGCSAVSGAGSVVGAASASGVVGLSVSSADSGVTGSDAAGEDSLFEVQAVMKRVVRIIRGLVIIGGSWLGWF